MSPRGRLFPRSPFGGLKVSGTVLPYFHARWCPDQGHVRFRPAFTRPVRRVTSDIPALLGGPIWVNPDGTIEKLGKRCGNAPCLANPTAERAPMPVLGTDAQVWASGPNARCAGEAAPSAPTGVEMSDEGTAYDLQGIGLPLRVVARPG